VQVRTRHTPAAGVARLVLAPGEPVRVEASAMLATSYGVAAEVAAQDGPPPSALGGAPPSVSTYTAPPQGGWVDVAPSLPGEVYAIEVDGRNGWCVTQACWLASASSAHWDTQSSAVQHLFAGQDGFLGHVSGPGSVVVSCCGALDVVTLQPGELVTVDPGHVVAYADTVRTRLRQIAQGNVQVPNNGAGLVFDFAGPGQVLTQTRNPQRLVSWLRAMALGERC
jgi:uncharacterized protein (TIGR00266 family)